VGNGYAYQIWLSSSTTGTNCGTVYGTDATFKANWNMGSGGDFLARVGLSFDQTKTYDQIGTISSDYANTKTGNGQAYIGIYGWTVSPLVEYYIVEDWNVWRPNFTLKGTITVDADQYDIYTHTQTNQPSIQGTATFQQWYSVRKTGRQCGHISISEHFKQWVSVGGAQLGKMYEAKLLVEALGGSGTVDFTKGTVVVN
jgi:endo-1,4-beta-xylanase